MNKKTKNTSQVLDLLETEHVGYGELLLVLEKQKRFVTNYNETDLLETIQEKEKILGRLHDLRRKIHKLVETTPEAEYHRLLEKTQAIRDKIEFLLKQILVLETYCENAMQQMKVELYGQVKSFRKNRTVLKGYGHSLIKRSSFSKNI